MRGKIGEIIIKFGVQKPLTPAPLPEYGARGARLTPKLGHNERKDVMEIYFRSLPIFAIVSSGHPEYVPNPKTTRDPFRTQEDPAPIFLPPFF